MYMYMQSNSILLHFWGYAASVLLDNSANVEFGEDSMYACLK
jgi:hypothetical protein